jgi:hypothetical protein
MAGGTATVPRPGTHQVGCVTWLALRLTLVGKGCRGVKFGARGWVDLLDFDGIHVCGFALRQLTRNFFDLAVEVFIGDHFEVDHLRVKPNAVSTAALDIDHEWLLAGPGRVPRNGKGVCSGIEMEGHESAGSHVSQSLRAVEEPAGKRLLTFWKETCAHALRCIAWSVEGDGACLSKAASGEEGCDQSNAEYCSHGRNRSEYITGRDHAPFKTVQRECAEW